MARYFPFGQHRTTPTATIQDRGFTGHKHNNLGAPDLELIYMNARYYLPGVGRFASADTIVPDPARPGSYNRYSYVQNSPLSLVDPTGHRECDVQVLVCDYVPIDPWQVTTQMLDLNADGFISYREEEMAFDRLVSRAERSLLEESIEPVESLGSFGGCNTISAGCANFHPAVDGARSRGDPIVSSAYGRVVSVGNIGGAGPNFGSYAVIEHDVYGIMYYSVYAHLDEALVREGDIVGVGDLVGTMGNTNGQGPYNHHLHYEVRQATNVDLSPEASDPFTSNYWAESDNELHSQWVDLGPVYGYHGQYPATWTRLPTIPR
ncbi:MAG: peptidoglycan DD-metalloendopeptidase family protein [Ardenticatenaceae bacterium]